MKIFFLVFGTLLFFIGGFLEMKGFLALGIILILLSFFVKKEKKEDYIRRSQQSRNVIENCPKNCVNCGAELLPGDNYCPLCGRKCLP